MLRLGLERRRHEGICGHASTGLTVEELRGGIERGVSVWRGVFT